MSRFPEYGGYEIDGLWLNEPGNGDVNEREGVFAVVQEAGESVLERADAATAAGLQWTQVKMLKPRPLQVVHIAPL